MGQNAKGKGAANGCLMTNLGAKSGKVAPRQTVVFEIQELTFLPFLFHPFSPCCTTFGGPSCPYVSYRQPIFSGQLPVQAGLGYCKKYISGSLGTDPVSETAVTTSLVSLSLLFRKKDQGQV